MKKTTYMLLGTVALTAVASFFIPLVFFEKNTASGDNEALTLAHAGKTATINPEPFKAITIDFNVLEGPYIDTGEEDLYVEITESESAESPVITIDESWNKNITATVEDNTLYLDMHMNGCTGEGRRTVKVPADNLRFAAITVPPGTLRNIRNCYGNTVLRDFQAAQLSLATGNYTFQAHYSSFTSLTQSTY